MNNQSENSWEILSKVKNPFLGILKCLYEIKFTEKKELTNKQKDLAFRCLNIVSNDEKIDNEIRAWCCNQLGLIYSDKSSFIKLEHETH